MPRYKSEGGTWVEVDEEGEVIGQEPDIEQAEIKKKPKKPPTVEKAAKPVLRKKTAKHKNLPK